MSRVIRLLRLTIFLFIIWACDPTSRTKQVEIINLKPFKSVSAINDTIFFSMIRQISEYKDLLYFTDFKNSRVLCVDTNLNYKYKYGTSGRGPGELIGASGINISDDIVYVADGGNKRINAYSLKGEFLTSIKAGSLCHRFTVDTANSICLCTLSDTIPFVKLNIHGNIINRFEARTQPCIFPIYNSFIKNSGHLLINPLTNHMYCVSEFYPFIEKYSESGMLLNKYDLSEIPLFKDKIIRLKTFYNDNKSKNRGIILFNAAYLYNSLIYVLYSSNSVLVFDIENDKMDLVKIIKLLNEEEKNDVFMSICVYNDNLISHNLSMGEIQVFKLK